MSEIVSLLTVFSLHLSATTLRQFCEIVFAVLAMTGGGLGTSRFWHFRHQSTLFPETTLSLFR